MGAGGLAPWPPHFNHWMIVNVTIVGIVPCTAGYAASSFGVSSAGGVAHAAADLTRCQLICSLAVSCVGLDYDGANTPPRCVTHHDISAFDGGRTTTGLSTTVQYTKVDACATS